MKQMKFMTSTLAATSTSLALLLLAQSCAPARSNGGSNVVAGDEGTFALFAIATPPNGAATGAAQAANAQPSSSPSASAPTASGTNGTTAANGANGAKATNGTTAAKSNAGASAKNNQTKAIEDVASELKAKLLSASAANAKSQSASANPAPAVHKAQASLAPQADSTMAPSTPQKRSTPPAPAAPPKPVEEPKPNLQLVGGETSDKYMGIVITPGTPVKPGDVDKNANQTFVPASIVKTLVASEALEHLGANFEFRTTIVWDHINDTTIKDLTIVADGDPSIADDDHLPFGYDEKNPECKRSNNPNCKVPDSFLQDRMTEMVNDLKSRGVHKVEGDLYLIARDPRQDVATRPIGVPERDAVSCFGAQNQAFNFRANCDTLAVKGSKITWQDTRLNWTIKNEIKEGASQTSVSPFSPILVGPPKKPFERFDGIAISGNWAKGSATVSDHVAVQNSKGWYGNALLDMLKDAGVDVSGVSLKEPDSATRERAMKRVYSSGAKDPHSLTYLSDSLEHMIVPMLLDSIGLLADTFFRVTASHLRPTSPNGESLTEVADSVLNNQVATWLTEQNAASLKSELVLHDGVGLSLDNKVSPRAYMAVLQALTHKKYFLKLLAAMPVAGQSGTLADRLENSPANGYVRAKTGTVFGSYQIAGYIPYMQGTSTVLAYVPFVILTNMHEKGATEARDKANAHAKQDEIIDYMFRKMNPHIPPPSPQK